MLNKHKFLLLLFSIVIVPCNAETFAEKTYVCEQLKKIPEKDREILSLFFETLLSTNFAYTLFGDKPVSCDDYPIDGRGHRKDSWLAMGKKIWDRYSARFPSEKFVFKYQHHDTDEEIFLINKAAFVQTVDTHLPLFQSILGSDVTAEGLLQKLSQENTTYREALNNHSGLMGLLYGFGCTNACIHYTLTDMDYEIEKWLNPPVYFFQEDLSLELYKNPLMYFRKLAHSSNPKAANVIPEELRILCRETARKIMEPACSEEDTCEFANLSLIPLPTFGTECSNRSEADALIEKYKKTRCEIMSAYHERDFLEVTLCKFIEK